jgi:CheY-like chemotaxis protein
VVRELSPQTRPVLMSGFASARDYQRAVELGAVRVLIKPFSRAELIGCIRQAIECEVGFRGSVHGLSLVDVLQMFNFARRSVAILVGGRSPGSVYLSHGEIVQAVHQGLTGEAALAQILSLPTGSLSTTVLPDEVERTITRRFSEVLLDALRSMDEAGAGGEMEGGFDLEAWDPVEATAVPAVPAIPSLPSPHERAEVPRARLVLDRVRAVDGYVAACLVSTDDGGVLASDGGLDLTAAAPSSADLVRHNSHTVRALGLDDDTEEILITAPSHYHLMRCLRGSAPAFVYLLLDRRHANAAMAQQFLASALRSLEL